jgi:TonB family protein
VVTYGHGKVFLKVEVDQAGVVRDVSVTRVIGEPNLEAAAREEALGTRFFPVHQRGTALDATFEYCIAFLEKQP